MNTFAVQENSTKMADIYNILFENAGESLILVDKNGTIKLVNPRLTTMFGYEKEELIGKKVEILMPGALRDRHQEHRKNFTKSPKKRTMGNGLDLSGLHKSGKTFPVEISLNHFSHEGELVIMGLITDISKRKQLEDELSEVENSLRFIHKITSNKSWGFEKKIKTLLQLGCEQFKMPFGILSKIENNKFKIIEQYGKDGQGRNNGSQNLDETFCSETIKIEEPFFVKDVIKSNWTTHPCYKNFKLQSYLGIKILGDGKIYGTLSFTSPTPSEKDLPSAHYEILKLMAEWVEGEIRREKAYEDLRTLNNELEKRVEERTQALQISQRLHNAIARNFPDGTINVFDRRLNYVFVEGKELFKLGIKGELLIGTPYIKRIPKEVREEVEHELMNVFKGKNKTITLELKGSFYELDAVPLKNSMGEIDHILVVEKNVTKQKKAEQEVKNALDKEKELNELKSRFVSMASHEFRTPLSTILSSVSLIDRYTKTEQNENRKKHVNRIKSSVHNLIGILNDFLSLDKLEEGKTELNPTNFEIISFCQSVVDEIQTVAKEGQKILLEHNVEKIDFRIDQNLLRNILNNLLSNAIKYSPVDEDILFRVFDKKEQIALQIEDHGIGIPEKDKEHMFERFFRAKNAFNIQGTGLGLNIVKKYVELTGGKIIFTSQENVGTIFEITLPK